MVLLTAELGSQESRVLTPGAAASLPDWVSPFDFLGLLCHP